MFAWRSYAKHNVHHNRTATYFGYGSSDCVRVCVCVSAQRRYFHFVSASTPYTHAWYHPTNDRQSKIQLRDPNPKPPRGNRTKDMQCMRFKKFSTTHERKLFCATSVCWCNLGAIFNVGFLRSRRSTQHAAVLFRIRRRHTLVIQLAYQESEREREKKRPRKFRKQTRPSIVFQRTRCIHSNTLRRRSGAVNVDEDELSTTAIASFERHLRCTWGPKLYNVCVHYIMYILYIQFVFLSLAVTKISCVDCTPDLHAFRCHTFLYLCFVDFDMIHTFLARRMHSAKAPPTGATVDWWSLHASRIPSRSPDLIHERAWKSKIYRDNELHTRSAETETTAAAAAAASWDITEWRYPYLTGSDTAATERVYDEPDLINLRGCVAFGAACVKRIWCVFCLWFVIAKALLNE